MSQGLSLFIGGELDMTNDEIDKLCEENGITIVGDAVYRLAQLIRARVLEEVAQRIDQWDNGFYGDKACINAAAIRSMK